MVGREVGLSPPRLAEERLTNDQISLHWYFLQRAMERRRRSDEITLKRAIAWALGGDD